MEPDPAGFFGTRKAVFDVSLYGHPQIRKLNTDLMGAACFGENA